MLSGRPIEFRPTLAPPRREDAAAALGVATVEHHEVIAPATDIEWVRQVRATAAAMWIGSVRSRHSIQALPGALRGSVDSHGPSMIRSGEIVDP